MMKRSTLTFLAIFASLVILFFSSVSAKACGTPTPEPSPTISASSTDVPTTSETPSSIPTSTETPSATVEPSETITASPTATVDSTVTASATASSTCWIPEGCGSMSTPSTTATKQSSSSTPSPSRSDTNICVTPESCYFPAPGEGKPDPVITYSQWMWSGVCTDTVVTQSRNVMTTDWVYATGYDYWIQDYTHTTSTFETRQHVILDSEKEDFLHYCFIDPPVEPVMLETYKLADTGSDMPWYLAGIALCISVIGFTMVFGVKKVKK